MGKGLGSVAAKILLDRQECPLKRTGTKDFIALIQSMLKGFKNFDPPTKKKLTCHPDLPACAVEYAYKGHPSVVRQATADLICIAFYYLLRIGEYTTKTKRKKKTRTRQFRMKDVTFFKYNDSGLLVALSRNASDEEILKADAANLRISNQKNGHAGACVHHHAIEGNPLACPVRALGRRFCHIRQHTSSGKAFICAYWDKAGYGNVSDDQVRFTVKFAAKALRYENRGIPIDRIDTHSLRSGGACALKLAGYDDVAIRKMGRWAPKSNAFLEYIHNQLSNFSAGASTRMNSVAHFTNMKRNVEREDLQGQTLF